jgi:hypothetical protein
MRMVEQGIDNKQFLQTASGRRKGANTNKKLK